jgi:hypothetical protein
MKNSDDTVGNRSRDLPVGSIVPQPLQYHVLLVVVVSIQASGGVLSQKDRVPVLQFCHVQEPTVDLFR